MTHFLKDLSIVSLAAALLAGSAAAAPPPRRPAAAFTPLETCNRLPGVAQFRAALIRAIRARDTAAFVALSAPRVKLDFGDGAGRAELRKRLSGADGRKLWAELDRIVPLGCAVQGRNLIMPSIFEHEWGDVDPFDVMVVTGANVTLRAGPSATARPIRTLSWALVEPLSADDFEKAFRQVKVHGGGPTGYIAANLLRSPLDYRMVASRVQGQWKIDAFLAGD